MCTFCSTCAFVCPRISFAIAANQLNDMKSETLQESSKVAGYPILFKKQRTSSNNVCVAVFVCMYVCMYVRIFVHRVDFLDVHDCFCHSHCTFLQADCLENLTRFSPFLFFCLLKGIA